MTTETAAESHHDKGQLIFDTVVLGATAVGGIIVWHFVTESTTSPD